MLTIYRQSPHQTLDEIRPDFIVNLVALTDVDECERSAPQGVCANVQVVEVLASWIQKNDYCHLIQISTDQVYDGSESSIEKKISKF